MKSFLLFWVVVLVPFPAFTQVITSKVYSYNQLPVGHATSGEERTLLEGTTRDFSHLIVQAITVPAGQPNQPTQELDEEAILIIRTGELTLTLGSKRKILGPASVVVIMPGDEYRIDNKSAQSLTYYLIRYTSNEMPDLDLYQLLGGSFWIDWQESTPTADHYKGNQQRGIFSTVMSNRMAMQITTLDPGPGSHKPHTHRAAEILLVLDQPVQVHIDGVLTRAQAGDIIFVESDVPHSIQNSSQEGSTYLSIQL